MNIKAWCENGHARVELLENRVRDTAACPVCREEVTREAVWRAIPVPYRPSTSPLGAVFQSLADYDIDVILRPRFRFSVEYPRPT